MKILMVTPYSPKDDGIAVHTAKLLTVLRRHAEVDILTQRKPSVSSNESGVFRGLSMNPFSLVRAIRAVRGSAAEVVHVQYALPAQGPAVFYALLAAAWVRRTSNVRLVVTCHEVRRELDVLRRVGAWIFRGIAMMSDVVVVHTQESRELLETRCGVDAAKIEVTPLGADPIQPPEPEVVEAVKNRYCESGRELVTFFGWIHPDKGIEDLIAATALLARTPGAADKLEVLICGAVRPRTGLFKYFAKKDQQYQTLLQTMVREASLESIVRFGGFVPDDHVSALLAASRVVVVPYRNTTQSAVLSQAIAAGVPVIASDLPGLRETLERGGGLLVPPRAPEALSNALGRLIQDNELISQLQSRQVALQNEIGFERVIEYLRAIYSPASGPHKAVA